MLLSTLSKTETIAMMARGNIATFVWHASIHCRLIEDYRQGQFSDKQ